MLSEIDSAATSTSHFQELLEKGTADLEVELVLGALIAKRNIRFYFVLPKQAPTENSKSKFILEEHRVNYDKVPDTNSLKLFLRPLPDQQDRITIDILCNPLEYEMLFNSYPLATGPNPLHTSGGGQPPVSLT